jgi:tetratricopeptide (TPR) repeat protein
MTETADSQRVERTRIEAHLADVHTPDERAFGYLLLGGLGERRTDWGDAVHQYGKALAEGASDEKILYFGNNNLGYSLIQLERFDEAEPYCLTAIGIDPTRHNAHKNLGLVRQGQQRPGEAAACFMEASRLRPSDRRSWHLLQALLAREPDLLSRSPGLKSRFLMLFPDTAPGGLSGIGRGDGGQHAILH